jgi:hypothetical protein
MTCKRQNLLQEIRGSSLDSRATPCYSTSYNADNQFTQSGVSYDGNGTPTGYIADINGQLTGFNDAYSTQAGYRDDGLRAWKQSTDNLYGSSSRTYFLYDGTRVVYTACIEAAE